ncbi:MAG TPA: NAD(P)/FAD-dependent oxidoreductase [Bryobacteraceae bacterium]|jgi:flavin-dependent dehydrogenase|nr:NAD(P)/FAD-dependent oxidoreductase [Bryobacteraceae bacterium]
METEHLPMDTDVFVVGGGPAGLAAAIAARAKGLRVIVADAARPPIDKACGEGLMPDSLQALSQLGIVLDPDASFPFTGIRFANSAGRVQARFPSGVGRGVRRPVLHNVLAERAQETGAVLLWGRRVIGIGSHSVNLDGETIRCQWIIGADGQNSRIRAWAGLDQRRSESRRFGFRRHYRVAPWTDFMEIYWGLDCQLYITPVSPYEVCVALISRHSHHRLDSVLEDFPDVQRRLRGTTYTSQIRGAVSASRSLRRVTRGCVALVGDASGSVDAITGDGLYLAFRQTAALADALAKGSLEGYQKQHNRFFRRPALISRLLLLLDEHPWLRNRVLPALSENPAIFQRMLAMHVGESSHTAFALDAILPLGWQLIQPR